MSETDSKIVAALKEWKSKEGNLHDHLSKVLNSLGELQYNGVTHFERISEYYKRVKFNHKQPLSEQEILFKNKELIEYPAWLVHEEKIMNKILTAPLGNSTKIIQNFQRQAEQLFQPVGISFGAQANYKINNAIKNIAHKENALNIRFWGKINTTEGDYFVIQGVAKKNKQPIVSEGMEKYREGANYYSFWVNKQIVSEDWYELPLITPQQLKLSRQIKHIFTGRLQQKILSYPKFPGQQRHLLKCQLVRITHNCEIAPNGLFSKLQQNPDQIDFSEEFKMPQFNDLANLENWVHVNPYILGVGRADYYKDPKLTQQQRQQQLAKLAETDPKIERLKGINEDKPVQRLGMQGCWITKQTGNLQIFSGKQEGTTNCYGFIILKNPHWPGWLTVANGKSYGSIYLGYGVKLTQDCFFPLSPQDLDIEGKQLDEFDEPNPRDPPDELQPDSDDENKKPEDS